MATKVNYDPFSAPKDPATKKSGGTVVSYDPFKTSAPPKEKSSFGKEAAGFGLGVAEAGAPIAVGMGAAIPGAEAGASLGLLGGPAAPVTVPLGSILGGLGGYFAGDIGARYLGTKIPKPEAIKRTEQEVPGAVTAGETTTDLAALLAGGVGLGRGIYKAGKGMYGIATSPEGGTALEKIERAFNPRRRVAEEKAAKLATEAKGRVTGQLSEQERAAREASGRGRTAEYAQQQLSQEARLAESRTADAQAELDKLNAKYQSMPQATTEQFGSDLKKALYDFVKKYSDARKVASGFQKMLKDAGAYRRVDTKSLISELDAIAKTRKSPQVLTAINRIKSMLTNTDVVKGVPREVLKLTVEQAHDVKMEIDNMIASQQALTEGGQAVPLDSAALAILKNLKKRVTSTISSQYKEYGKALTEYAKASRPLDVIERNANLRKLTSLDAFSQESKILASDFVGKILGQANKGSQILSRLIQESPELKNSARMYFTRELFGKAEKVTADTFKRFMFANQGKLQAAGLLEEFSTMRGAQKAAEKAFSEVEVATQRVESILRTAETPEQLAARTRSYTKPETVPTAMTKLGQMAKGAEADKKVAEELIGKYRNISTQLDVATDTNIRDVIPQVRQLYKSMADSGVITDAELDHYLRHVADAEKSYKSADQLRSLLKYGLITAFGVSVASGGGKALGAF